VAWLLDTNVLSELRKGSRASAKVRTWADGTLRDRHYISVLSLGEIRKGIELLRKKSPEKCPEFERWLAQLHTEYSEDIIPISEEVAEHWGRLTAIRTFPIMDGLIAATALAFSLTIATRNVMDFNSSGVETFNPFA